MSRNFNNSNITELAPFTFQDGVLKIEKEAYEGWSKCDIIDILKLHFKIEMSEEKVPRMKDSTPPVWYDKVYKLLFNRNNAYRWWNELIYPGGAIMLYDTGLSKKIQNIMDKDIREDGWFIKCGSCSTKHSRPVFNAEEALTHLFDAESVQIAIKEKRALCVAIRPWNKYINKDNEIRVFVQDNKISGISRQFCYDDSTYKIISMWKEEEIIDAAQKCFDEMMEKLLPSHRYPYQCTFDAYILSNDEGMPVVNLIEINSGEFGWGPAGSGLFNWITDPPIGRKLKY